MKAMTSSMRGAFDARSGFLALARSLPERSARGGIRTRTLSRAAAFETAESASSSTRAGGENGRCSAAGERQLQQLCANRKRRDDRSFMVWGVRSRAGGGAGPPPRGPRSQPVGDREAHRHSAAHRQRMGAGQAATAPRRRPTRGALDHRAYSYLLGMYLGDGHLTHFPRTLRPPDLPRQPVPGDHRGVRPRDPSRDAAQPRGGLSPSSRQRGPRGLLLATVAVRCCLNTDRASSTRGRSSSRTGSARSRTRIRSCWSAG